MKNLQKVSIISGILKNPNAINVLSDLLNGGQVYTFFSYKYGRTISFPLRQLTCHGLIKKRLNKTKKPIGYSITDYGRLIVHACFTFEKSLLEKNVD